MKGLKFAVITTLLVVGAVAMLPQAVSAQLVLTRTKTLPAGGTNVAFTLATSFPSVVVQEILVDNTGTTGPCPQFFFRSLTINTRPFRPGGNDTQIATPGANPASLLTAIRSLFSAVWAEVAMPIPLERFSRMVMTFSTPITGDPDEDPTSSCTNNVILRVIVGVLGSGATLN